MLLQQICNKGIISDIVSGMRIAFVGKGGSGKTTASSLFAQRMSQDVPVLAIDADINMHMAELLSGKRPDEEMLISEKGPSGKIRTYLRGNNPRIASNDHFKKTTPPGNGSNLINVTDPGDWMVNNFATRLHDRLALMTVGSYSEEGVASSCYHNNLSVLENVLTHTVDNGVIVTDMVAGTDAFANTLFSQFDMLVFVVEPTTRSIAVLEQYQRLANHTGFGDRLFVIANKVEDDDDYDFIKRVVNADKLLGRLSRSKHLLAVDKGREALEFDRLSSGDKTVFENIARELPVHAVPNQSRLPYLWELHKIYINQGFVKDRFGDLTDQIDTEFQYPG
jgi:CO dehydrogenase maturation factor